MTSPAIVAIHGGAGTILREAMDSDTERQYRAELTAILTAAQQVLADGGSALDAVTVAVRMLEDCPLFNAGRGAVYTAEGKHELDAAVMDGATLGAGAICCATRVRNPVLAARRVMEASEHVLFAGEGADAFAAAQGRTRGTGLLPHRGASRAVGQRRAQRRAPCSTTTRRRSRSAHHPRSNRPNRSIRTASTARSARSHATSTATSRRRRRRAASRTSSRGVSAIRRSSARAAMRTTQRARYRRRAPARCSSGSRPHMTWPRRSRIAAHRSPRPRTTS